MPITNDQIEQAFRIANEQLQVLRNSTPINKGKTFLSAKPKNKTANYCNKNSP